MRARDAARDLDDLSERHYLKTIEAAARDGGAPVIRAMDLRAAGLRLEGVGMALQVLGMGTSTAWRRNSSRIVDLRQRLRAYEKE